MCLRTHSKKHNAVKWSFGGGGKSRGTPNHSEFKIFKQGTFFTTIKTDLIEFFKFFFLIFLCATDKIFCFI